MSAWGNSFGPCSGGGSGTVIVESIGVSMSANEITTSIANVPIIDVAIGMSHLQANMSMRNISVSLSINE